MSLLVKILTVKVKKNVYIFKKNVFIAHQISVHGRDNNSMCCAYFEK